MALDPRRFIVKNCAVSAVKEDAGSTARKDFFSALGKVGDIEALNKVGDGRITEGLRNLAGISDSIRTGDTNSAIIPNDRGYVLTAVGINENEATLAGRFNPGVLNKATSQADNILKNVKDGKFKLKDIPNAATDFQNLKSLMGGVFTEDPGNVEEAMKVCGASPYAIDLIKYAPKYKFLFIVQITLNEPYYSLHESANILSFVVKNSTRPNVNIEHEDVNMYNFWTRIPKRVVYEPITMKFIDDGKGISHEFFTSYLRSISPIHRKGGYVYNTSAASLEVDSMGFNSIETPSSASLTALEGDNTSIMKEIRLFHLYDYGTSMNVYHFHNPKIITMNLDDLDMSESGTGNEIELQFAYDALHTTPALAVEFDPNLLRDLTGGESVMYPINPNFRAADQDSEYDENTEDDVPLATPVNVLGSKNG